MSISQPPAQGRGKAGAKPGGQGPHLRARDPAGPPPVTAETVVSPDRGQQEAARRRVRVRATAPVRRGTRPRRLQGTVRSRPRRRLRSRPVSRALVPVPGVPVPGVPATEVAMVPRHP